MSFSLPALTPPVLVTVNSAGVLVAPTLTLPKSFEPGESVRMAAPGIPVPATLTDPVTPSIDDILKTALRVPVEAGANVATSRHVLPGSSLANTHVLLTTSTPNSAAAGP